MISCQNNKKFKKFFFNLLLVTTYLLLTEKLDVDLTSIKDHNVTNEQ